MQDVNKIDVAIVGAGLSGIGMAAHLRAKCPQLDFSLVERRDNLGGTWDLFRYPGIRSDSDMHTLGFEFEPWTEEKAIAGAPAILDYLNRVVDQHNIRRSIRFGTRVVSANWNDHSARWRLVLETGDDNRELLLARFLFLGSGYYDYDAPHDAQRPGLERFGGQVIHPQFWPEKLDYTDKRVVVIGSGATAVTIVPAMVDKAALVTMLQRTPTWLASRPSRDMIANTLRRVLPERTAYSLTRLKNIHFQDWIFRRMKADPAKAKAMLSKPIRAILGTKYKARDFTPPYDPWDQRLCLTPDDDLFAAINSGKAQIVTDRIVAVDERGIALQSGKRIDADIIVTATGLKMAVGGKIALSLDGQPLELAKRYFYKSCMISNVPNFAVAFGYLNASWTLRVDMVADYLCQLFNRMEEVGADVAMPEMRAGEEPVEDELFEMSSGYLQRGAQVMPRSTKAPPWTLGQNYLLDRKYMRASPLEDGIMTLSRADGMRTARGEEEWRKAG